MEEEEEAAPSGVSEAVEQLRLDEESRAASPLCEEAEEEEEEAEESAARSSLFAPPSPLFRTSGPVERDALAISALLRAGSADAVPEEGGEELPGSAVPPASSPSVVAAPPGRARVTSPTPAEVDEALGGLPALLASRRGCGGTGGGDSEEEEEAARAARSRHTAAQLAEDDSCPAWRAHRRHFFVFTAAGKPVYSRYGEAASLAGFTASLAALCAFVQDTGGTGEALLSFRSASHAFTFLHRGPLTLAAVTAGAQPQRLIRRQLQLLHSLVISLLTSGVEKALEKSPRFDARTLLGGTERVFQALVHSFTWDPSTWLHASPPLALPCGARRCASAALAAAIASQGLLAALLLTPDRLVASAQPRRGQAMHPDDVLLVCTLVRSARSFRDAAESFSPVCLPVYNPAAFAYAYVAWLAPQACLVLLTAHPDGFPGCSVARRAIEAALTRDKILLAVFSAQQRAPMMLSALPKPAGGGGIGASSLWHFLYLSTGSSQFVFPPFAAPLSSKALQKRLLRAYAELHCAVHAPVTAAAAVGSAAPPASQRVHLRVSEAQCLLAVVGESFELYAAFDPLTDTPLAVAVANRLCAWLRTQEAELLCL